MEGLNDHFAGRKKTATGVLQGLMLELVLFLIMTNELKKGANSKISSF